ncbi:hypothetical protein KFU94_19350 [Chloroflexi bacterium TSY]|nr:hypothetical protein [Chloroflexi bacterium TSY]
MMESNQHTQDQVIKKRDDGITLIATGHFALGGLFVLLTGLLAIPTIVTGIVGLFEAPEAFIATSILGFIATIMMLLSLLYLIVGYGLWMMRNWARVAAIALSILGIILSVASVVMIPIGGIISGFVLWHLLKKDIASQFA